MHMLTIGTKPEYFNAVWVKNEWSRFLKIIKNDRSKLLIPCYRDMDAYELPEEFAHLQAQDMAKIGFINDIVRGIKKVASPAPEVNQAPVVQTQVIENANGNVNAFLDRGFMALEDGEWEKADEFFEQALNFDAKLAEAYLGKLMVDVRAGVRGDLKNIKTPFDSNHNYQKVIRFGNQQLKDEVEGYNTFIIERIKREAQEAAYKKAEDSYINAKNLMCQGNIEAYKAAADIFDTIINHKDSKELKEKCFEEIKTLDDTKNKKRKAFEKIFQKANIRSSQTSICAASHHTVGLNFDGAVVATRYTGDIGSYSGQCDVYQWTDILAISAGEYHTVGLKTDGSVVATKYVGFDRYNGQCDVSGWSDIVAISAGSYHTVGLKSDGTVVAVGENEYGQCHVSEWTDIVAISAGTAHTVGLKSDGTVVATNYTGFQDFYCGECDVSGWSDIVAISAGSAYTIGLKADGTVIAVGDNEHGQCDVSDWEDIVAIFAGAFHTVGLKSDGKVVAVGNNDYNQCNVSDWRDIVAISVGEEHTVGLKSDGTVITAGSTYFGKCEVSDWENITLPILAETREEYELKKKERDQKITAKTQMMEEKRREFEQLKAQRRSLGVCQYCGGSFKGLIFKTCTKCGEKKDYECYKLKE